jgi:hypothetical protein
MGHLSREDLARMVSEEPSPREREHLESCTPCRSELEALHEQTEAIGSLPDLRPPSGDWEALEARLVSEGLVRSSGLALQASRFRSSGWFQAAAALVLFLGGSALGSRATAGPGGEESAEGSPTAGLVGTQASQPAPNLLEATQALHLAELLYRDAFRQYWQVYEAQGQPSFIGDPAARLAALQGIVAAGQAGVQQAPADPFINGVLVSALAEREAVLRTASPTPGVEIF